MQQWVGSWKSTVRTERVTCVPARFLSRSELETFAGELETVCPLSVIFELFFLYMYRKTWKKMTVSPTRPGLPVDAKGIVYEK